MADPAATKDKAPPTAPWPSPWPYDFPVETKVPTAPDKVARVTGAAPPPEGLQVTRRGLFGSAFLGWGAFLTASGVGTIGLVRFLFPNVSFEPPPKFPTAPPQSFAPNSVSETWKETNAVWIANVEGRILAISTVCTHLGCTPNWLASENKFKCPCHGSGYDMKGVNFEGPTPRPLERFALSVNPADGMLWVDKTRKCQVELGQCDDPAFYLNA
jgi:cytochrome b6-f complex iron-sulfur subunit